MSVRAYNNAMESFFFYSRNVFIYYLDFNDIILVGGVFDDWDVILCKVGMQSELSAKWLINTVGGRVTE